MKRYFTIGRDLQSDIVLNDETDVVSRRHAILEVGRNGKYFITDQSRNGTYVNGIRISSDEKVPVTRRDTISFAHMEDLDWNRIPKDRTLAVVLSSAAAAVAVVLAAGFGIRYAVTHPAEKTEKKGTVESVIPGQVHVTPETVEAEPVTKPSVVDGNKKATEEKAKTAPKPKVVKKQPVKPEAPKPVPDAIY